MKFNPMTKIKILFVCMGNICRSPTAHGVFQHLVQQEKLGKRIEIESAGTHAYHVGSEPDRRALETAAAKGIDLGYITARQVCAADYDYYDYILAMDNDNYAMLKQACPEPFQHKIRLFLDFSDDQSLTEVPDPYYGGIKGFSNVFAMIDRASKGLLDEIKRRHL